MEFGQRESSRGSIDRKEVSINAIRTSLRRPNPGALAQSKFQFVNGSGYSIKLCSACELANNLRLEEEEEYYSTPFLKKKIVPKKGHFNFAERRDILTLR